MNMGDFSDFEEAFSEASFDFYDTDSEASVPELDSETEEFWNNAELQVVAPPEPEPVSPVPAMHYGNELLDVFQFLDRDEVEKCKMVNRYMGDVIGAGTVFLNIEFWLIFGFKYDEKSSEEKFMLKKNFFKNHRCINNS